MPELSSTQSLTLLCALIALWFAFERGLTLMKFFQQEEYDSPRFINWLFEHNAYDKTATIWFLVAAFWGVICQTSYSGSMGEILNKAGFLIWPLIIIGFLHGIILSRKGRQSAKKPLVITARVKRILVVYAVLTIAVIALLILLAGFAPSGNQYAVHLSLEDMGWSNLSYDWRTVLGALYSVALAQVLPFLLVVAEKALAPFEERIKAKFRAEAVQKFNQLKPKVIAITGSFGKTSTKHILQHILSAAAPTLATPGSVNTDMGITRVIREQLTPEHQYFIVEMGAYGPGSIARLCTLTPPDVGLITAVGAAHYERFKSLETVARAKFELAQATFEKDGPVVVNSDGIAPELLADGVAANPGNYLVVGGRGDITLTALDQTAKGLVLTLSDKGEEHVLKTPLHGKHQAENIITATAAARAIGLPWAAIKGALASMPQIRHRLEVSKTANGPTILNDAYNANPIGFAAALEALDVLAAKDGRRILITPGMVELGEKHDEEHANLGTMAAQHCDVVLIVTPGRIPTFVSALNKANSGKTTVMSFETQDEAEAWVKAHWQAGDAVLFENNLPDLYEAKVSF